VKQYKIAVMGATGSGKTVFFGSYFNSVINQGGGDFSVSPATPDSVKEISRITTTLFEEHLPVMGTAQRTDISFNVPSLGMQIILHDIPGGYTQDAHQWAEQKIIPDLESANGVLFFISGEDLIYHLKKCIEVNAAFTSAIDHLRIKQKSTAREDVPVWFLFTKGDLIPNVALEDLQDAIKGLRRAAEENRQDYVFKTGRNVRFYKVTSLGKWKDSQSLPEEYQPENVVESMEELLKTVKGSVTRHRNVLLGLLTVAAMLIYLITVGGFWWFDQSRWNSVLETVNREVALSHYDNALQSVNSFPGRLLPPRWLLPQFLRVNAPVEATREGIYVQYEKAMYAALRADIEAIDYNKIPNSNSELFLAAAKKVGEYLKETRFSEINPQGYEAVRKADAYYTAGQILFRQTFLNPPKTRGEIFDILQKGLSNINQFPAWSGALSVRIDELARQWANFNLPEGATAAERIRDVNDAISGLDNLMGHPNMQSTTGAFLEERRGQFIRDLDAAWKRQGDEWLKEASETNGRKAIDLLASRQNEPGLPAKEKDRLVQALSETWTRLCNEWMAEASKTNGRNAINLLASRQNELGLPAKEKGRLVQALNETWTRLCNEWITEASKANGRNAIDLLVSRQNEPGLPAKEKDRLVQALSETWTRLCNEWITEASQANAEEGIKILFSRQNELGLPSNLRSALDGALNRQYERFVNFVLARENDEEELKDILGDHPAMPPEQKTRLENRVEALKREKLTQIIADINGSDNLEDLLSKIENLGSQRRKEIGDHIGAALQRAVNNEISAKKSEWQGNAASGDFSRAKKVMDNLFKDLFSRLNPILPDLRNGNEIRSSIEARYSLESNNLRADDLSNCRRAFNAIRNTRDKREIASVVTKLNEFIARWPSEQERREVDRVINFLTYVQGGSRVTLSLENGDFSAPKGWLDTALFDSNPDVYILIYRGDTLVARTNTIQDKAKPNFGFRLQLDWTLDTVLTFVGFDEDTVKDNEIFRKRVEAVGLFGYKALTQTLSDNGCELRIKLEENFPECPW
jgi:hypothetical protein